MRISPCGPFIDVVEVFDHIARSSPDGVYPIVNYFPVLAMLIIIIIIFFIDPLVG